jgi:putative flippase GtrA
MTGWRRWTRFNAVGALGVAVQVGTVALATRRLGIPYGWATAAGVGAAVLHNFLWHRYWTWADRGTLETFGRQFLRFAAANGAVSLAGNLALMALFVGLLRWPAIPASAAGIAVCGAVNYWVADARIFGEQR